MAILVTGATGFLGSHVARKLVERGERVRILLRKTSRTSNIEDIDAERAYGDILDIDSGRQALKGCDTLYHVAGIVSSRKSDYGMMEEINVKRPFPQPAPPYPNPRSHVPAIHRARPVGVDPNGGI